MTRVHFRPYHVPILLLLMALAAAVLFAQIEGERGVPPIASGGDYEVGGVKVDVAGPDAISARNAAWKQAQRTAWRMLWAKTNGNSGVPALSDSQLDAIVSGIETESEQVSANRYIATLAIMFDRARAGQILGVHGDVMRSPPLLVIPVLWQGGTATSYESINEWQKAWARYRTGESAIDYVRTSGSSADPLLLDAGQLGRRSRNWWRVILDQYGAADVIMPVARLERQYPGGPVIGHFNARYGPNNGWIGGFTLRSPDEKGVPQMMDEGVRRIDQLYVQALMDGILRPDPSLVIEEPVDTDALAIENATDAVVVDDGATAPVATGSQISIQYDTPGAAAVGQGEALLRSIPGVTSALTSSLALGGTSVMQVSFSGTPDMLRVALQARGYTVSQNGNTLRISRRQAAPATEEQ